MEDALVKIRPHISSSLPHQKAPAVLLIALESAFEEQHTDASSTAYFAALLTTIEETIQRQKKGSNEDEVLYAELYLLALIAPFVPTPVIRSKLNHVLTLTGPFFYSLKEQAPALRSQLSLYHVLYKSLDRHQLDTPGIRQTFASVLHLCIDLRPKVRKKAGDIIKDVLANPPAPFACHPYSEKVVQWVETTLSSVTAGPLLRPKEKAHNPNPDNALYVVTFLRPIITYLPPPSIPGMAKLLLALPQLGHPYLSQSAYTVLSDIFSGSQEDGANVHDALPDVLKVVLSSPPSKSDTILSPAWVQLLANAFVVYRSSNSGTHASELGDVWKAIWRFLDSNDTVTRKAAARSLSRLCNSFTPALVTSALEDESSKSALHEIISGITKALESLTYARAVPELLSVASSIVIHLRHRPRPGSTSTAAESLFLPFIERVGNLRMHKNFEHKEAADATLSAAMGVLGPHVMLRALPLNLEPADRQAGREPRAFMLSLLPQAHPSPLSHFVSYFVPLSERMFDLKSSSETENRPSEAKVWSVLVAQIWSGLVGYCYGTPDLKESLTTSFAQLLSQLLYGYPEVRPAILRALKVMVESNVTLAAQNRETPNSDSIITPLQAQENVNILRSQAESWLAVLFNVFDSVGRDSRGMVGEVISTWASITGDQEIAKACGKVLDLFKANVQLTVNEQPSRSGMFDAISKTATAQDLLILLLPYLPNSDASVLWNFCLSPSVLCGKDNGVQKRGYKILTKLVEDRKVSIDAESIIHQLDELSDGLLAAAKKDRFSLLTLLVSSIPSSALHLIPSLVPEAVLGTKEPSEKSRSAAFGLIVAMANKMNEGGVVKRNLVDGMVEDSNTGDTTANVEEFITMVAGGLAASPHMISATVTAISRLVFEFKDVISEKMQTEIFTTLLVFLSSANREIVKSILGFVKLSIHTLPTDVIRPHLKELVTSLLIWSHDHKNHFKAKVRHIFERMLRRFSWDEIYSCASEEDAAKVLVNIKKRKERAKRKKENRSEHDDDEAPKRVAGDAFEDVLYGGEDDSDDSENDMPPSVGRNPKQKQKQKRPDYSTQLQMDDDEPIDLLSGAASKITSSKLDRRRKAGQDATHFKTDDGTGKMIIEESGSNDEEEPSKDVAGVAYRESMTSEDGFTRGHNGQIKFNKNTKKRRQEAGQSEDVEMADGENVSLAPHKKKIKDERRLGHEFKAKKAGGDVKKKGMDPYAYVPLSQAARKGQRSRGGLGITRKK